MRSYNYIFIFAAFLLMAPLLLFSCKEKTVKQEEVKTYTCPMHPQIVQTKAGTCPICGMDLVLFDKNNQEAKLVLSKDQLALANVAVAEVNNSASKNKISLNGRLVTNPADNAVISSRISGRVENLYVKESGIKVSKGQPLYRIYSEELLGLQQEYLVTKAQEKAFPGELRFREIARAAEQKLLLYQQTPAQLRKLQEAGKSDPFITYFAPVSGQVSAVVVTEGQYVAEGTVLMQVENYQKLWVEADLYPSEAPKVSIGMQLEVIVDGRSEQQQKMRVDFIEPAIDPSSQLLRIRGTIPNLNQSWQPGLSARVILPASSVRNGIFVPTNAIIRDNRSAHVWKQTAPDTFIPVAVKTGEETMNETQILEGIAEGEKIVTSGAYLLYSEYVLKKGRHPVKHQH